MSGVRKQSSFCRALVIWFSWFEFCIRSMIYFFTSEASELILSRIELFPSCRPVFLAFVCEAFLVPCCFWNRASTFLFLFPNKSLDVQGFLLFFFYLSIFVLHAWWSKQACFSKSLGRKTLIQIIADGLCSGNAADEDDDDARGFYETSVRVSDLLLLQRHSQQKQFQVYHSSQRRLLGITFNL